MSHGKTGFAGIRNGPPTNFNGRTSGSLWEYLETEGRGGLVSHHDLIGCAKGLKRMADCTGSVAPKPAIGWAWMGLLEQRRTLRRRRSPVLLDDRVYDFTAINTPPRHHLRMVSLSLVVKAVFNHESLAPKTSHGVALQSSALVMSLYRPLTLIKNIGKWFKHASASHANQ
jgi:hypothetical protein